MSASSSAITRGWPNFKARRFFAIFVHGRLHHSLDAFTAQATVMADAFDFQQAPIDLPAYLLQVR